MTGGGRFDFDDGGTYCGGWEDGKADGYGVCTGPKGQGEYAGAWQHGFEISGIYTWPSGNCFEGQWMQGKRHGVGIEQKGKWVYKGEWTQGFKGRYGSRQSTASGAKYEGTWTTGLQDGYGVETYADGGTYQGQWLRGMRHGYGVRQSVPYGMAAHYRPKAQRQSLTSLRSEQEEDFVVKDRDRKIDEGRGGFVLSAKSDGSAGSRRPSLFDKQGRSSIRNSLMKGLKLRKQKSTGDIQETPSRRLAGGSVRSTISNVSNRSAESAQSAHSNVTQYTDSNQSFVSQDDIHDVNVTETYMGEWKNDKRSGFGVSERSDGLKYEGDWYNNKKHGYGVTIQKDGSKEEGKWKNNVLITSGKKTKIFLIRSSKLRERVDNAVTAAQRAAQIALQKADIANSRMANARAKSDQAEMASHQAHQDSDMARIKAKDVAPDFHQPGTDILKKQLLEQGGNHDMSTVIPPSMQNHMPHAHTRSNSLMMRRHGSAGNGSLGGRGPPSLTLDIKNPQSQTMIKQNHTPNYNTLPNNISKQSTPLIGNHVSKKPTSMQNRYAEVDGDIRPTSAVNEMSSPMPKLNGRTPMSNHNSMMNAPTQRLSVLNSNDISSDPMYDHNPSHTGMNGDMDTREYGSPDRFTSDRHSEDRYSVDRYSDHQSQLEPSSAQFSARSPPPHHIQSPQSHSSRLSDTNPSSDFYAAGMTGSLKRRKSMPSIVKHTRSLSTSNIKTKAPTPIRESPTKDDVDTFVIENGIHKRIHAEVYARPPSPTPSITSTQSYVEEKPLELPKRYTVEPTNLVRASNRGSLPDVSQCKTLKKTTNIMPRTEAHKLGHARREELRRLRENEEQRRKLEIVLRLADVKDWCQQRQLLMIVIALNISLATMFFNLLT